MACENTAQNFRSSYILLRSQNYELEVPLYQGDFSASGLVEGQSEIGVYTAQGENHTLRKTTRIDPSGSFTAHFPGYSHRDRQRLLDLITRKGYFAGSIGVQHSICTPDVYLLDIVHVIRGDGTEPDRGRVYEDCRLTCDYSQGDPDSLSVSWTCYGEIVDSID